MFALVGGTFQFGSSTETKIPLFRYEKLNDFFTKFITKEDLLHFNVVNSKKNRVNKTDL